MRALFPPTGSGLMRTLLAKRGWRAREPSDKTTKAHSTARALRCQGKHRIVGQVRRSWAIRALTQVHPAVGGASGHAARSSLTVLGSVDVLSLSRKILSLNMPAAAASSCKCRSFALFGTMSPRKTDTGLLSGASNGMATFVRTNAAAGTAH